MLAVEKGLPGAALAELKAYLRIDGAEEDALLSGVLRAATETVEAMLGILLIEREVRERATVRDGKAVLTAEPARSLGSAALLAEDGSLASIDASALRWCVTAAGRGSVELTGVADGAVVELVYRAGTAVDWSWIPEVLRLAVLRAAAHFHAHRDAAGDEGLPPAVRRMIAPWRTRRLR